MKTLSLGALLMVAFAVAITASPKDASGVTYTFLQLEPAGDPADRYYPVTRITAATGINNLNQIVGHDNGFNGVFYSPGGGVLSIFNFPGSQLAVTHKINDLGTVVGYEEDRFFSGRPQGFTRTAEGVFTTLTAPNGEFTELVGGLGINNHGDVVGEPWPSGEIAWLMSNGTATLVNVPTAFVTKIADINDFGHRVGQYVSADGRHGYFQTGPTITDVTNIDHPLALFGQTYPMGLNNRGEVVGWYFNTTDVGTTFRHGFAWQAGVFTPLDYQGLAPQGFSGRDTVPNDINDAGWVVGETGEGTTAGGFIGGHAWLAIPDSPGSAASNPILPDLVGADGVFAFTNVGTGQWFDPPASVGGYTYTMTGGELFTGILGFPSGFVTSVSTGTVLDNGTVSFGSGVSSFTVTFSPTVELGDTDAFPLQLSFSAPTASFTMTPASQDTTPPVLTLPSNLVADATGPAGATVFFAVSATDLIDGARPVACTPASGAVFVIGLTTVNCTTADTQGNAGNGGFTVIVRSAAQIVTDLSALATSFAFKEGSKLLQNVLANIGDGDTKAACGQLAAFVKQAQAQAGKKLTVAQAAALIAAANKARAALGCS